MPDPVRAIVATMLATALSGCLVPQAYGDWSGANPPVVSVAAIRQDPAAFLAAHQGQRVQVEGWFVVDHLAAGATHSASGTVYCEGPNGGEQWIMLPDVNYNRTVHPQLVRRRVVVEGVAGAPRELSLGGGDLTVGIAAEDMVLVLDQARVVAADWAGAACNAAPFPAP